MKTRRGFVSNSSSASFICEICDNSYEENCGGGGETAGWERQRGGVCHRCLDTHAVCAVCNSSKIRSDLLLLASQHLTSLPERRQGWTDAICPACLIKAVEEGDYKHFRISPKELAEFAGRAANPDYEPTKTEEGLIEALKKAEVL